jgi:hypothetical protein
MAQYRGRDSRAESGEPPSLLSPGESAALNGSGHFPMQSVYKLLIAMALLHLVGQGKNYPQSGRFRHRRICRSHPAAARHLSRIARSFGSICVKAIPIPVRFTFAVTLPSFVTASIRFLD